MLLTGKRKIMPPLEGVGAIIIRTRLGMEAEFGLCADMAVEVVGQAGDGADIYGVITAGKG
jgi:hypothetical protein